MHLASWIALAIVALLAARVVVRAFRARLMRLAAGPPQHRPHPAETPRQDEAALTLVGTVAADGARSAMG